MKERQELLPSFMEDGEEIPESPSFSKKHSDIEEEEALKWELSGLSRSLHMCY